MKRFYLLQVLWHKWCIVSIGLRMGKIPLWRLIVHDWTKFLPCEYCVYRRRFTGKKWSKDEWERAKWHHFMHNPHHFQYWVKEGKAKPMPEVFVREMVADWLAADCGYQGSTNIQEWINRERYKMTLHPDTISILKPILESQGLTWPSD